MWSHFFPVLQITSHFLCTCVQNLLLRISILWFFFLILPSFSSSLHNPNTVTVAINLSLWTSTSFAFLFPACLSSASARVSSATWGWPFSVTVYPRRTSPRSTRGCTNACAGTWRNSTTMKRKRQKLISESGCWSISMFRFLFLAHFKSLKLLTFHVSFLGFKLLPVLWGFQATQRGWW